MEPQNNNILYCNKDWNTWCSAEHSLAIHGENLVLSCAGTLSSLQCPTPLSAGIVFHPTTLATPSCNFPSTEKFITCSNGCQVREGVEGER